MAFTGRLGTRSSRLGNIVFGISDGLGTGPLGFDVHVLSENEIRVRYSVNVTESALKTENYSLVSIAAPGTAVTPAIVGARFYDEKPRSVVLVVSPNMTTGTDYSLEVSGVEDGSGDSLVGVAKNFTANVPAPPRAIGAFQSKRGYVDVVFDKPVGPSSASALFEIRDASSVGPGVPMSQAPWAGEAIPEDTLRVSLPGGTPSASRFAIDFAGVTDASLNVSSGSVPLTLALRSPPPYSLSDLLQFQITDAYVLGGDFEFLRFGVVRVFWNGPAAVSVGSPSSQFTVFQNGPHPVQDPANAVAAPDAFDLASLIALCTDFKSKFNDHLVWPGVHFVPDTANLITSVTPTTLQECIDLLNEAQTRYLDHLANTTAHIYEDYAHEFVNLTIGTGNQALAIAVANLSLKSKFNQHLLDEQEVDFYLVQSGIMNYVSDHATEPTYTYDVRSAYTYFADLSVRISSSKVSVRIEANVMSQDSGSSSSSGDFTGSFVARPYAGPAAVHSLLTSTTGHVEVRLTGDISVPSQDSVSVVDPDSETVGLGPASVRSTLATLAFNVNFLSVAFNRHRSGASAGHEQEDTFNLIASGVDTPDLQSIMDKANELKNRLNQHVRNDQAPFHLHPDPRTVTAPDADDLLSLVRLLEDVRSTYLRHNQEGPHLYPGYVIYNSGLHDVLHVQTDGMVDGAEHELVGRVRSVARQIPGNGEIGTPYPGDKLRYVGEEILSTVDFNLAFSAVSPVPAIASALPKSGLEFDNDGSLRFESDQVEVYFSRPMARVSLNQTNLPVTGGSILQKESDWVNDRVASIRVVNMDAISYTVAAVGLTDRVGNPVV